MGLVDPLGVQETISTTAVLANNIIKGRPLKE